MHGQWFRVVLQGSNVSRKIWTTKMSENLSALHVEMERLIWAMSYLRDLPCTVIHTETDFSDLMDMIANPTDWSAFNSELVSFRLLQTGFSNFSIIYIPKNRNLRNRFSREGGEKQ